MSDSQVEDENLDRSSRASTIDVQKKSGMMMRDALAMAR